jgi:glutaredoxin 2
MSFKRLQAEKYAADAILRELTPVEGITDAGALRDYLQNLSLKIEVRNRFYGGSPV